jgi:23S rRNA (adenine1618-N6)-methyltransferase
MDEDSDDEEGAQLGFKVEVRQEEGGEVVVGLRWVRGVDAVLWESFCGMVRRGLVGGG